ncbi:MAG: amidohydrolase [Gemmatimonadota bacterium]|nr:amidohydrolase [Gemmatimonadota bacterium]
MRPIPRFVLLLLLLLAAPGTLAGQSDAEIAAATARLAPRMIEIRHDIHLNPEVGNHETRTAGIIAAELTRLGLEVRTGVAHTGVIGILRGGKPGPVVAIRADMDALPVTELTDVPFKSIRTTNYLGREVGVSHACGHDTHVAAQLGVANLLAGMKAKLTGTVVFIFQPAEEGLPAGETGGAKLMVEEGALTNPRPDLILAFHANGGPPDGGPENALGRVAYTPGPTMASATRFSARVIGRQAHGSTPHLGIDAIVTSSQIVLALQTIRSRSMSPFTPSVVTVGVMRGGDRNNIVAGEMLLEGTIRTFTTAAQDSIEQRMREIFDGITKSVGASFTLEFDRSHPVTVNDTLLAARFDPVLRRVLGSEHVTVRPPITGSEDFSYFAQQVPGFYVFVGAVPPGKVSGGHHTPTFYADDGTVPVAMRVMSALVISALGE